MCRIGSAAARHDLIDKLISRFAFLPVVRRVIKLYRNHRSQIAIAKQEIDVLPVDRLKCNCGVSGALSDLDKIGGSYLSENALPSGNETLPTSPRSFGVAP